MKTIKWSGIVCAVWFAWDATAQSYSIDWYKISGGGGTSTSATYQVTGTIGQPEAGSAMNWCKVRKNHPVGMSPFMQKRQVETRGSVANLLCVFPWFRVPRPGNRRSSATQG